MEFKNPDINILYVLVKAWSRSGTFGPFDVKIIHTEFSDIPDVSITAGLMSLLKNGLIYLHDGGQKIFLTSYGVEKIKQLLPIAA
ncbi:MAG: hypothetical protein PVJ84_11315 [Desulfobacteraceae bacterium]|jgi:hypothetical protein